MNQQQTLPIIGTYIQLELHQSTSDSILMHSTPSGHLSKSFQHSARQYEFSKETNNQTQKLKQEKIDYRVSIIEITTLVL